MKSKIFTLMIMLIASISAINLTAQNFESRVIENEYGYLVYQMRETSGVGTPTTSTNIVDITFVIRYPSSALDMSLLCANNNYDIIDGLGGAEQSFGGYDYHYWNGNIASPIHPPHDWVPNVWEDIAIFTATGATGTGLFDIAPQFWDGRFLNWNQGTIDYLPVINGDVTYDYPTIVYDYMWTGASSSYWDVTGNWVDQCGGAVGSLPTSASNCFIPVSATYPTAYQLSMVNGQPACNNLRVASGAMFGLATTDLLAIDINYTVQGSLLNYGMLSLPPNSAITVNGSTFLDAPNGLSVVSDATGTGSFIDNGTITYGISGSAKVQTYVENTAVAPAFFIHFIAPTVQGMDVIDFNVSPNNTYAYAYNQASGSWDNVSTPYAVNPGSGIAMSTVDGTTYTQEAIGQLNTGSVVSALAFGGTTNQNLIGNPYPSAINFDALATANASLVYNKYYIWNPSTGAYVSRSNGTGGTQNIQVGQAFFVETKTASGNFSFTNTERTHSNDPFRDVIPNVLEFSVTGGGTSYLDQTFIRFQEGSTNGYDFEWDAKHWDSWYEDATMLCTVAEDGSKLAINMLPKMDLTAGNTISVPMQFNCGHNGEYTITAANTESFEDEVEVWVEDSQVGSYWANLSNNGSYTFYADKEDNIDRFVVHFFGPTSISEHENHGIQIYGDGRYVVVNNVLHTERIDKVQVFNINGFLISEVTIKDDDNCRLYVGDITGIYVVRVYTNKAVVSQKVLISGLSR